MALQWFSKLFSQTVGQQVRGNSFVVPKKGELGEISALCGTKSPGEKLCAALLADVRAGPRRESILVKICEVQGSNEARARPSMVTGGKIKAQSVLMCLAH